MTRGLQPSDGDLEDALRNLLAHRGRTTSTDVRRLIDGMPSLPDQDRGRPRSWLGVAAVLLVAVVGGAFVTGRLATTRTANQPDDGPSAFAGDQRLTACEATTGPAAQVFEMTHAEWFPLYFPGWWKGAPELEVSDPALVVIGATFDGPFLGAPPQPGSTPDGSPRHAFRMCIAVGPPDHVTLYQYGPTWFDRIVPVLSDADIERAAHLDPDVLGDPAAWPFSDRLAPCGGLTGHELYIFEANPLSDFARYFPNANIGAATQIDEPGIVIVYRDPLPLRRAANERPYGPTEHDVCVVREESSDQMILPRVDIAGFHLRIDRDAPASPETTPAAPSATSPATSTPEPAPAWAGDASTALDCDGESQPNAGSIVRDTRPADSPETQLLFTADAIRFFDFSLPTAGYELAASEPEARLYVVRAAGRVKTALAITTTMPGQLDSWSLTSVASCGSEEFEPATPTGTAPIGHWFDAHGDPATGAILSGIEDCYQGTQVRYSDRLFVRIPHGGVDPAQLETTWRPDVPLPESAIDTGLHGGSIRLFRARDGTALYVANGNHAERLPHVIGDEVVRTDCN